MSVRIGLMTLGAAIATAVCAAFAAAEGNDGSAGAEAPKDPAFVLDFTMERLEGGEEKLAEHKGDVILIVNVASQCGLTPQYAGLERLYEKNKDRGFVILGFPANNFNNQEPGSNKEIAEFCSRTYNVTFPMYAKISVKGDDQHALYKRLTTQPAPVGGEVQWNFQKYLVDRHGRVVAKFDPRTRPDDEKMLAQIEALLAEKSQS